MNNPTKVAVITSAIALATLEFARRQLQKGRPRTYKALQWAAWSINQGTVRRHS